MSILGPSLFKGSNGLSSIYSQNKPVRGGAGNPSLQSENSQRKPSVKICTKEGSIARKKRNGITVVKRARLLVADSKHQSKPVPRKVKTCQDHILKHIKCASSVRMAATPPYTLHHLVWPASRVTSGRLEISSRLHFHPLEVGGHTPRDT